MNSEKSRSSAREIPGSNPGGGIFIIGKLFFLGKNKVYLIIEEFKNKYSLKKTTNKTKKEVKCKKNSIRMMTVKNSQVM
jgi:hypothetical protein|tara:strand:- start:1780 stop:2016 length:237 start_codon:yes stop_codon:yes gene_type:complete